MTSIFATGFSICRTCGIIDRDAGRMEVGANCNTCQIPQQGGLMAFHLGIFLLLDLVHEVNFSSSSVQTVGGNQARRIGTVVFFCTLREALLNWFVEAQLRAQQIPERIANQLISDNKLASQKFGPLFLSLTGVKWTTAVSEASKQAGRNFGAVSELMRSASELRNSLLHGGDGLDITDEFADKCFASVNQLLYLFVVLHNVYTHPLIRRRTVPE